LTDNADTSEEVFRENCSVIRCLHEHPAAA
jgi:hypothetical protein